MSFDSTLAFLLGNLGIGLGDLILFLCALCGFIFMAKELRIGLIAHLILFTMAFLGLNAIGLTAEAQKALIAMFIVGIAMTLSLFTSYPKTNLM